MSTMFWDEPKRLSNIEAHGLDFFDARDRFEWETALIYPTHASRRGGSRFVAVGLLDSGMVTLVFSRLGSEAISAISLRPASTRERRRYDQG